MRYLLYIMNFSLWLSIIIYKMPMYNFLYTLYILIVILNKMIFLDIVLTLLTTKIVLDFYKTEMTETPGGSWNKPKFVQ